jgi:hypothetical protein
MKYITSIDPNITSIDPNCENICQNCALFVQKLVINAIYSLEKIFGRFFNASTPNFAKI